MVMDVVERINELAAEEKCPHCDRSWHERALTSKVARMFESGSLDRNYFAYEDTSRVLCDGSRFIGPLRPEPAEFATGGAVTVTGTSWSVTWSFLGWMPGTTYTINSSPSAYTIQALNALKVGWGGSTYSYMLGIDETLPWIWPQWKFDEAKFDDSAELEPVCAEPVPEVDVEFGPQNWSIVAEDVHAEPALVGAVAKRWHAFQRDDTPKPAPKEMDLKPIAEKFNQQFNYFNKEKNHEGK